MEYQEPEPPQMNDDLEETEIAQIKKEREEEEEERELQQMNEDQEEPEAPQIKEDQEEPEPLQLKENEEKPEAPQVKEDQQEVPISQDEEKLVQKQEMELLMVTPPHEEKLHSGGLHRAELLKQHSHMKEEVLPDQELCNQEGNCRLSHEKPEPAQSEEDQDEPEPLQPDRGFSPNDF
ncbi:hypothetical protein XENOCAPTIV_023486, partial [Xenoophorus captivus]